MGIRASAEKFPERREQQKKYRKIAKKENSTIKPLPGGQPKKYRKLAKNTGK